MKNTPWSLFVVLLLLACEPEPLPVDGVPAPEKTVVIGSQNLPTEFIAISVTENFNALEGGTEDDFEELIQTLLLDGLDLSVEVADSSYTLNEINQTGVYVANDVPEIVGEIYTLSFLNPFNDESVTASVELLPFIGFDSVNIYIEETPFDSLVNVVMRVEDPPGPNWYMINVQLINEDFDFNTRPFTELLTDSVSTGSMIDYEFRVFFRDYAPGDTVMVSMANISKGYYDFLELRGTRRGFVGSLGEPITYPTNVENGLGYFHMHIPDVRFFFPGLIEDE